MSEMKVLKLFEWSKENTNGEIVNVKGRIETDGKLFYWIVSHLFRPTPMANYYNPSNTASTFSSAKNSLMAYVKSFTTDFVPNDNY
jgi:hypothetical protein